MDSADPEKRLPANTCKVVTENLYNSGIWNKNSPRNHLVSPEPFYLTKTQVEELEHIGQAVFSFYQAANKLYTYKGNDWVNEYLDLGKPEDIIRHSHMNYQKQLIPRVLRPDIMLTSEGFVITELDSVPGGIGHLDCLSAAYEDLGFELIGSPRGMRNGFKSAMLESSNIENPCIAILVSDESEDYRPEMTYLVSTLQEIGIEAFCVHPSEITGLDDGLYINTPSGDRRIDLVYRFYELFDLDNIPTIEVLLKAAQHKKAHFTPPHKHFLEEKLLLGFLHHEALAQFWTEFMGENDYNTMLKTVVPTWILDNRPVPPHAHISGFLWNEESIRDWLLISNGTQKQRAMVIKPSGFSPLAWGSRGVRIGSDMSQSEWANVVGQALDSFNQAPHVLQVFREGMVKPVSCMNAEGDIDEMEARVRLCPYYFIYNDKANLAGVMATACPKDKKLVHGMKDAVIVPCATLQ